MRAPKPFFRPKKKRWYVQIDGKQINLGPDEKQAWDKYHRIMADQASPQAKIRSQIATTAAIPAVCVLDSYLDWLQKRVEEGSKAQRTFDWYQKYLQSFAKSIGPTLMVDSLEPIHVYSWVDAQAGWKTGKRGAMIAVQRAFNWAARAGLLKSIGGRSPVAYLEKPPQGRREQLVSEAEYREVLAVASDQEFQDLLELSWETGCRPHELFTVEAAFFDLATARWVFPIRLSKGKKVQRVVYLSDRALEITRRLVLKNPTGPVLLNTDGGSWCVSSVKCRFQNICQTIGRRRIRDAGLFPPKIPRLTLAQRKNPAILAEHNAKYLARKKLIHQLAVTHGIKLNLYAFRHSMITESLVNGVDAVTTSVLAGHRDTTMISRHYAHLTQKHEHMRLSANRARGAGASA